MLYPTELREQVSRTGGILTRASLATKLESPRVAGLSRLEGICRLGRGGAVVECADYGGLARVEEQACAVGWVAGGCGHRALPLLEDVGAVRGGSAVGGRARHRLHSSSQAREGARGESGVERGGLVPARRRRD